MAQYARIESIGSVGSIIFTILEVQQPTLTEVFTMTFRCPATGFDLCEARMARGARARLQPGTLGMISIGAQKATWEFNKRGSCLDLNRPHGSF